MYTALCLSSGDTHQKNCGNKENFSNAVGCELKFLKIDPEIKNPLILSVQYDNLMRVNGCRLTLVREFSTSQVWFGLQLKLQSALGPIDSMM